MLSEKPWKIDRAVIVLLGTFVVYSLFGVAWAVMLRVNGGQKPADNSPVTLVLVTLSTHGSILAATALAMWWFRIRWREAFGFATPGAGPAMLKGATAAVLFLPVGWLLQASCQWALSLFHRQAQTQEAVQLLQKAPTPESRAYLVFFAILFAPAVEEIFFRGILYPAIKQAGWPRSALWGTSALFAASHLDLQIFVPLFVLGVALAWLYELTDNLLASITAHGVFNGVNVLMLFYGDDLINLLNRRLHAHP